MDGDFDQSDSKAGATRGGNSREPPVALTCGVMPSGVGLHHFHGPPLKVHARNAETSSSNPRASAIVVSLIGSS